MHVHDPNHSFIKKNVLNFNERHESLVWNPWWTPHLDAQTDFLYWSILLESKAIGFGPTQKPHHLTKVSIVYSGQKFTCPSLVRSATNYPSFNFIIYTGQKYWYGTHDIRRIESARQASYVKISGT